MLGIGIDWAEEFHDVALGTQEKGVIEQFRIEHGPAGVAALIERALRLEPDPAEVRVVLETRHGLLVEALLDAGFTVIPVNPDLVARRRGPARKKDDAEDARICCLLALDRHAALKTLIPHGEIGGELRAIGRDDERAARDQRRLLNRLRADLQTTFPAALALAGKDLGAPTVLRLLERWPTQPELAAAGRDELVEFARRGRHGWPERFADQVARRAGRAVAAHPRLPGAGQGRRHPAGRGPAAGPARGPPRLGAPDGRAAARRPTHRPRAHRQGPRPGEGVPGRRDLPEHARARGPARRPGRRRDRRTHRPVRPPRTACSATPAPPRSPADPGKATSSSPAGSRTTTTSAPRSTNGRSAACNRSGWAREFYDQKIAAGKGHHAALRALGNRWLEILWHCLTKGVRYDETVHVANRNRALGLAA